MTTLDIKWNKKLKAFVNLFSGKMEHATHITRVLANRHPLRARRPTTLPQDILVQEREALHD